MYSVPVYIQYLYSMCAYVCTVLTRLHLLYALCFVLISPYSLPLMHVRISHSFINPSHTPSSTHHTLLHQPITHSFINPSHTPSSTHHTLWHALLSHPLVPFLQVYQEVFKTAVDAFDLYIGFASDIKCPAPTRYQFWLKGKTEDQTKYVTISVYPPAWA